MRPASLRAKLLWGTILVITLVMTGVFVVVEHRQRVAIIDEFQRRGEVLARNLAAISYGPLLLYNYTALEQNVTRAAAEDDVRYALVLDADGKVAVHSGHPERVGSALEGAVPARAAAAGEPLIQESVTSRGESIYDFAVPVRVEGRKWGTIRVGLSKQRMDAEIRKTRLELGALTLVSLLLGCGAAAVMARRIARPVHQLAEGAAALSRGEVAPRIEASSSDEIGRLAAAFNHMAVELAERRRALEEAHHELQRQFVELADLKSYTDNILGSLANGIVTVGLDGRVVTLNPAAELLTGFFKGEVSGRYCSEIFAHTPAISDILMETLASRAPITGVNLTLRRRNGSAMPVEFSTAPLKGGEGKDLGVIGVLRDLTLVRRLESECCTRSTHGCVSPAAKAPASAWAAGRERPAPLGSAGRARHARGRPRPRDQEPADLAGHVQPSPRAEVRRRPLPREVPERGAARAGADQRDRRAPARARPPGTDERRARAPARAPRPRGGALREPDRGPADRGRPRIRPRRAPDPG